MRPDPADELRIRRLRRLPAGEGILSVYLETEPGLALVHGVAPRLMDVLRELREQLPEAEREAMDMEAERALAYLREDYVPQGQSLAIFSSSRRRLWEVLSLQLPLRSQARFRRRPYLVPLEVALNDHPRIAVALVSEEDARLFTVVLGASEAEQHVHDQVPGRQRQGGWSAFRYQRDRERHVDEHFRHVMERLVELEKGAPSKWVVVGGTDQASSAVRKLLPQSLSRKLAGTFREEQFEEGSVVVAHALEVAQAAEQREDLRLVETVRDRALSGGRAVLGWDASLQALGEGRVHQLVLAGSSLETDRADQAFDLAAETGASVEVVRCNAEQLLAANQGVGALLRY